jgi:HNH endonuclease
VRLAVERRSAGACESCGLEWPWSLYLFRVEEEGPNTAANLVVLCSVCSAGRGGSFVPLIGLRTPRAKLLEANNRRAAVEPLTPSRRRALIADRGACCEACGRSETECALEVHHKLAVLRGGDDGAENLQVLCFACHRHLQPCLTGCGALAGERRRACQNCLLRNRLEALMPEATWEQIKTRFPGFVSQWKPGYEPKALDSRVEARLQAGKLAQPETALLQDWLL